MKREYKGLDQIRHELDINDESNELTIIIYFIASFVSWICMTLIVYECYDVDVIKLMELDYV